jgi:hypothetical protein
MGMNLMQGCNSKFHISFNANFEEYFIQVLTDKNDKLAKQKLGLPNRF